MSTEFKLYNVNDEDLYRNKSPKEKFEIRKQMIVMAKERGIKPTARYFNTYPGILNGYFRRKKAWQNKKMSILYTTNKGRIWYTLLLWAFG